MLRRLVRAELERLVAFLGDAGTAVKSMGLFEQRCPNWADQVGAVPPAARRERDAKD
jgi:hypothetical protein